ncbi:MAG: hypothetical protein Q9222_004398 [Ikaeria aurantiellina]
MLQTRWPGTTGIRITPSHRPNNSHVPYELAGHGPQYFVSTGGIFIGVTCMFLLLCTAAVIGRFIARRWAKVPLQADDYASLLALILFVAVSSENFLCRQAGSLAPSPKWVIEESTDAHHCRRPFHHPHAKRPFSQLIRPSDHRARKLLLRPYTDELQRLISLQLSLVNALTYAFIMTVARSSVLLLYRRVFSISSPTFRWLWWICVWLVVGYFVATLVGIFRQCSPHSVSALWQNPRACHGYQEKLMIMGFINAVVDLCVLALPIRPVWKLQMSRGRRLMVCAVFGLGLL